MLSIFYILFTDFFHLLETCRVPKAKLMLNYVKLPPYIYSPKHSQSRPHGIMMNMVEGAILFCAKHCKSFNEDVYFSYKEIDVDFFVNSGKIDLNSSELLIPRINTGYVTDGHESIFITESPGFVLLGVQIGSLEKAAMQENSLLSGMVATLPLMALYIFLNWAFGAIFWICVSTYHKKILMLKYYVFIAEGKSQ